MHAEAQSISKSYVNDIAFRVVGAAIEVHKELGPGLLESVYESCFIKELKLAGLHCQSQVAVPVFYKGENTGSFLKLDLLVEDLVIVELKAVETMLPVFKAQTLSYMRLSQKPKGLLINFNCVNISRDGLVPLVNEYFQFLPE